MEEAVETANAFLTEGMSGTAAVRGVKVGAEASLAIDDGRLNAGNSEREPGDSSGESDISSNHLQQGRVGRSKAKLVAYDLVSSTSIRL